MLPLSAPATIEAPKGDGWLPEYIEISCFAVSYTPK